METEEMKKSTMEMEEVKKSTSDQGDMSLPGFRFHPTDEELVGFYLRKKVEKKPIIIELIKQIDIYKYDPWDLPKVISSAGEKEWYFFCLRGRKYRNSIRPNRVTRSGFWKATGIDRPIYSLRAGKTSQLDCIGLKKSLVYYRGSAGKGTKTDWMMHEFRLPPAATKDTSTTTTLFSSKNAQEAEVWTICRIFRRTGSNRKFTPPATLMSSCTFPADTYSSKQLKQAADKTPKVSNIQNGPGTVCEYDQRETSYNSSVLAGASAINKYVPVKKQQVVPQVLNHITGDGNNQSLPRHEWRPIIQPPPTSAPYSSFSSCSDSTTERACKYGDWDELGVVVDCAMDPNLLYMSYR